MAVAAQKRFTVGAVINRMEPIGKALFDDGTSYGLRFGYNFDEHIAAEVSYDLFSTLTQETLPGKPTTGGQQLMASFHYKVKDDRGFIPYILFGLGAERYDNSQGSLSSGGIAGVGLGAHFLLVDPLSLRFEVKDVVRFADVGHTFVWTFGLEFAFGEMERYPEEEVLPFSLYPQRREIPRKRPEPAAKQPAGAPSLTKGSSKVSERVRVVKRREYPRGRIERAKRSLDSKALSSAAAPAKTAATTPPAAVVSKSEPTRKPLSAVELQQIAAAGPKRVGPVEERVVPLEPPKNPKKPLPSDTEPSRSGLEPAVRVSGSEIGKSAAEAETSSRSLGVAKPSPTPQTSPVKESSPRVVTKAHEPQPADFDFSVTAAGSAEFGAKYPPTARDRCSQDGDGDGVADCKDRCEGTPRGWRVDGEGCAVGVTMLVTFDFDSVRLDARGREQIGRLADYMQRKPEIEVVIEGHTDSVGTDSYNLKLSKRRALKVKNALIDLGTEPDRVEIKAYGESKPLASNATPDGRSKNRRADAVIVRYSDRRPSSESAPSR